MRRRPSAIVIAATVATALAVGVMGLAGGAQSHQPTTSGRNAAPPRPQHIRAGQSFHDPDDAFFTPGYTGISTNEEFNDQMALISIKRHRITWAYGRAGVSGSAAGELSNPDDAYALPRGRMSRLCAGGVHRAFCTAPLTFRE